MSPITSASAPARLALGLLLVASLVVMGLALVCLIALAGLKRLSGEIDLTAAPAWLWYYRADRLVARWLNIGFLAAAGGILLLGAGLLRGLRRPLHGAARWARNSEIAATGLRDPNGLLLGRAGGKLLSFGGAEHVLLYAPTRSGKGVGVVIPNLLNWAGSVVVLDVKRENWTATAGFRAAHGQTVLLFDPLDPKGASAHYNPLAHIDRADPVTALDELQRIAGMLFPSPPRGDPFWAEAARTGFVGVGGLVAESPDLPFTLGEIYRQLTVGDPKTRLSEEIKRRRATRRPLSAGCVTALSDFCAASDNTFASIRQTLTSRMGLWLNPLVDQATSASDFDLRDLRTGKTSLYLGATPENLGRVAPLYNLLVQQLFDLNTRALPAPGDASRQVLVMLDEFARLGHAPVLAHAFSFVAGYGFRLVAVLQSPAQLRGEFGPDLAEEIIANCGVEVVFAPKDVKTAQTLSERLGYYGLASISKSRPLGLSSGRRSVSESDQRRALMLPQELLALSPRALIVLRAGAPPVRGSKLVYYRDKAFIARLLPPPALVPRPAPPPVEPDPPDAGDEPPAPSRRTARRRSGEREAALNQIARDSEPADLDALAGPSLERDQVDAWAARYIDRAALEASLIALPPSILSPGDADDPLP